MPRINNQFLKKHKWQKNQKNRHSRRWKRCRKRAITSSGCTFCSRPSKCSMDCTPSKSLALLTTIMIGPTKNARLSLAVLLPTLFARLLSWRIRSMKLNVPKSLSWRPIQHFRSTSSLSPSIRANWTLRSYRLSWSSIRMSGPKRKRSERMASIIGWQKRQMHMLCQVTNTTLLHLS